MTIEEIIKQLESLCDNSKSFIDPLEPGSEWHKDIWALEYAIALIKKTSQSANCKGQETNKTWYHYNTDENKNKVKKVHLVSEEDVQRLFSVIRLAMSDITKFRTIQAFGTLDRLRIDIENYIKKEDK